MSTVITEIKEHDHRKTVPLRQCHISGLASGLSLHLPTSFSNDFYSLSFNIFTMLFPLLLTPLFSCPPSKRLFCPPHGWNAIFLYVYAGLNRIWHVLHGTALICSQVASSYELGFWGGECKLKKYDLEKLILEALFVKNWIKEKWSRQLRRLLNIYSFISYYPSKLKELKGLNTYHST